MNLEEIISAAVDTKIKQLMEDCINGQKQAGYYSDESPTGIERIVLHIIDGIAKEEIKKHEDVLRAAVLKALNESPVSFEVSAHSRINFPPKPKDRFRV